MHGTEAKRWKNKILLRIDFKNYIMYLKALFSKTHWAYTRSNSSNSNWQKVKECFLQLLIRDLKFQAGLMYIGPGCCGHQSSWDGLKHKPYIDLKMSKILQVLFCIQSRQKIRKLNSFPDCKFQTEIQYKCHKNSP